MVMKKETKAKEKAEKLREKALKLGIPVDSDANAVLRAENAKKKSAQDATDAKVQKEEDKAKSNVPTSEALIKRIKECKSIDEINAIEADVIKAYGENIPDEINLIADAKMKEFLDAAKEKEKKVVDRLEWKVVTIEEKDKAEKDGKLRGWNPRTLEALIG